MTDSPDLDVSDIARAARGDRAAFERVYRATVPRVHALARRLLGGARADHATQEVFVRAWRHLRSFRGDASFRTWLERIALNVILSERSRARGADVVDAVPHPHVVSEPGVRIDLECAIERLPAGARAVFVLHDLARYRHEEIAAMLAVSVGTSKSQLHRARSLLRAALSRAEGTRP